MFGFDQISCQSAAKTANGELLGTIVYFRCRPQRYLPRIPPDFLLRRRPRSEAVRGDSDLLEADPVLFIRSTVQSVGVGDDGLNYCISHRRTPPQQESDERIANLPVLSAFLCAGMSRLL